MYYFFYNSCFKLFKSKNRFDLKGFDPSTNIYIKKIVKYLKKNSNFSSLVSLISNKKKLENLINKAMNDPCWRLYKKNVDINLLKKFLINEKY